VDRLGRANPSIPRKFGLGLIFNGLAFLLLMFALSSLLDSNDQIPFWTLFTVYVIQSIGELCLSPIGLSMVTKLAPLRLVGLGMGGWFLSTGIGNNLSGIFASEVSGETGMTAASALEGYTFGFWVLLGGGVLLFLVAPLIQKTDARRGSKGQPMGARARSWWRDWWRAWPWPGSPGSRARGRPTSCCRSSACRAWRPRRTSRNSASCRKPRLASSRCET
jgi:MFS family permease